MIDEATGKRTFDDLMNLWVIPEIKRRQAAGALPLPVILRAAQIVFFADGEPTVVRLNEEVRGKMKIKPTSSMPDKRKGDPCYFDEIEEVIDFAVDDPNAGHATLLRVQDKWMIVFDFRYNRATSKALLKKASQFLQSATLALENGLTDPCLDNLFSAAELAAKAYLILSPDPALRKSKKHTVINSRFNLSAKLGNVDRRHSDAFNLLDRTRSVARYSHESASLAHDEVTALREAVSEMVRNGEQRAASQFDSI